MKCWMRRGKCVCFGVTGSQVDGRGRAGVDACGFREGWRVGFVAGRWLGVGDLGYGLVRAPFVGVDADRMEGGVQAYDCRRLFLRIGLCVWVCRLSRR